MRPLGINVGSLIGGWVSGFREAKRSETSHGERWVQCPPSGRQGLWGLSGEGPPVHRPLWLPPFTGRDARPRAGHGLAKATQ